MRPPAIRLCLALATLAVGPAGAELKPEAHFTFKELEQAPDMDPKRFANLFSNFRYSYYPFVQPVDTFLGEREGDCDDYALLADHILSAKGYHTRVIQVSMAGSDVSHAVCYVTEKKAYLDYNNRRYVLNLEGAGPTIRQIAAKVADSFEKNWTTATEYGFSYATYRKIARFTVVKTDPSAKDPDRLAAKAQ